MNKLSFVIAFILILSASAKYSNGQENSGIRIVRGKADTVGTALLTLVGHTFPGSNIQINGIDTNMVYGF